MACILPDQKFLDRLDGLCVSTVTATGDEIQQH